MPRQFFRPDRFTLVRGGEAEQVDVPIRGNGMGYEAEEVMRCLRAGLIESPLIPHAETLDVMRTLDAVRAQIGVSTRVSGWPRAAAPGLRSAGSAATRATREGAASGARGPSERRRGEAQKRGRTRK